jgi:putative flippase GtrA
MTFQAAEVIRYVINGLFATAVHYGVLRFNIEVLGFPSAGLANAVAAVFGIATSFLGSRYFVFARTEDSLCVQAARFAGLYGAIALLHGLILLVWTDWLGQDYTTGFLLATVLQVALSYLGNKIFVFKP